MLVKTVYVPRDERSGHGARASSLAYPATGVALWRTARSHAARSVARYSYP